MDHSTIGRILFKTSRFFSLICLLLLVELVAFLLVQFHLCFKMTLDRRCVMLRKSPNTRLLSLGDLHTATQ